MKIGKFLHNQAYMIQVQWFDFVVHFVCGFFTKFDILQD